MKPLANPANFYSGDGNSILQWDSSYEEITACVILKMFQNDFEEFRCSGNDLIKHFEFRKAHFKLLVSIYSFSIIHHYKCQH